MRMVTGATEANGRWAVTWLFEVPWAHPCWKDYMLVLYNLDAPGAEVIKYKPNVTHEFILWALDPAKPVDYNKALLEQNVSTLQPGNHGFQFYASSNEVAEGRLASVLQLIAKAQVSPDTDFGCQWRMLFQDGVSLKAVPKISEMLYGDAAGNA